MNPSIRPPAEFRVPDGKNRYAAWKTWSKKFQYYADAIALGDKTPQTQVACLLAVMGEVAGREYDRAIAQKVKPETKFPEVLKELTALFKSELNATQSRFELFNVKQNQGQLEAYLQQLDDKAEECGFCDDCKESVVTSIFIIGLDDSETKQYLLHNGESLTKPKALKLARNYLNSKAIESTIRANTVVKPEPNAQVDALQKKERPRTRSNPDGWQPIRCKFGCKTHPQQQCRAARIRCFKCRRTGHYSSACPTVHSIDGAETEDCEPSRSACDELQLFDLMICEVGGSRRHIPASQWWQRLSLGDANHEVNFKLDSGASICILPWRIFVRIPNRPALESTRKKISSYTSHTLKIAGTCRITVSIPGDTRETPVTFYVVYTTAPPILGLPECEQLGLIQRRTPTFSHVDSMHEAKSELLHRNHDLFDGELSMLPGIQSIELDDHPPPRAFPPRRLPIRHKEKIRETINEMENRGVIARTTKATKYVLPMVVVSKSDGSFRICLDPRYINPHIKRRRFPLPITQELFMQLSGAQHYSVVDGDAAFWHLRLDQNSSDLCTFATPWGNYQFKRLPFGIVDASERFSEIIHSLFSDLKGVLNCVDDFLIFGRTRQEHDDNLRAFFNRCRKVGLKLNPRKFQHCQSNVTFLGHIVGKDGVAIPESRINAIQSIPAPKDQKQVRQFLGMINYVAKFIPNTADLTAPLRQLTRSDTEFTWNPSAQNAFNKLKSVLTKAPVLAHFDPAAETTLSVDASSFGLGAVLLQKGKPVAFASTSLTETQTRYAQIEKELLAIVYACEHFKFFIQGQSVTIETDHRPLTAIVKKELALLSPRLQKMMLRLLRFDFKLQYVPGRYMFIADALSRTPMPQTIKTPEIEDNALNVYAMTTMSDSRKKILQQHTQEDPQLKQVMRLVNEGWPDHRHECHPEARPYWDVRNDLMVEDGIVYRQNRLTIPEQSRRTVLQSLHSAHQGIECSLRLARTSVYWPGLAADVRRQVEACTFCQSRARANSKEPLMPFPAPPHPWHTISIDFMHLRNKTYIVGVDYFTRDFMVRQMQTTNTDRVVEVLGEWWFQHGIPQTIITDNGPPFSGAGFASAMKKWDIEHKTSSPNHAQSHGLVERTIQTLKGVIEKTQNSGNDVQIALMTLRNTPSADGISPAELSCGRRLRSSIPASIDKAPPSKIAWTRRKAFINSNAARAKHYFDQRSHPLHPLRVNQKVWVWMSNRLWRPAVVTSIKDAPRSYEVRMDNGVSLRRNRRDLRPDKTHEPELTKQSDARSTESFVPGAIPLWEAPTSEDEHNASQTVTASSETSLIADEPVPETPSESEDEERATAQHSASPLEFPTSSFGRPLKPNPKYN